MKIFFIRHGETTGDIENRYGGSYDDHLSPQGIAQSQNLAEVLKSAGIETLFASSLIRAQETARILADALRCGVQTVSELQERNQYGFLSGMEKSEAKEKYPKEVEMLTDRLYTIDGAESYETFSARIGVAFASITNNSEHTAIALISHGGPLRVLFRDILKWGELVDIGDCAVVELEKKGDVFTWVRAGGVTPQFQISAEGLPF